MGIPFGYKGPAKVAGYVVLAIPGICWLSGVVVSENANKWVKVFSSCSQYDALFHFQIFIFLEAGQPEPIQLEAAQGWGIFRDFENVHKVIKTHILHLLKVFVH
jgi:hypothetical protein